MGPIRLAYAPLLAVPDRGDGNPEDASNHSRSHETLDCEDLMGARYAARILLRLGSARLGSRRNRGSHIV
jgi:hypothetical protein